MHFAPGLFALTRRGIRVPLRPFHLSQPAVLRPSECRRVRREAADFPATSEIEEGSACRRGRTRLAERPASRKSSIAGTCVHQPNVSLNRFLASAPFFFTLLRHFGDAGHCLPKTSSQSFSSQSSASVQPRPLASSSLTPTHFTSSPLQTSALLCSSSRPPLPATSHLRVLTPHNIHRPSSQTPDARRPSDQPGPDPRYIT